MDGSIFPGRLSTSEALTGYTALQCRLENSKLSKWHSGSSILVSSDQDKKNSKILIFCFFLLYENTAYAGHYILSHVVKRKIIIWVSIRLKIVSMSESKNRCFRDALFKQVV